MAQKGHDQSGAARTSSFNTVAGRDARHMNILIARVVAETVKTTLGPKGSKKMLVDQLGGTIVTGDGAAILKKIHVVQPIAKLMVEIAKTQEAEAGDGTTTAVVLTGELLKRAEDLLNQGLHPTAIVKGYRIAEQQVINYMERLSRRIEIVDVDSLKHVAAISLNSKVSADLAATLSSLAVEAVKHVTESDAGGKPKVAKENIKIVKQEGKSIGESEVVHGLVIETDERILKTAGSPTLVKAAKIAVVNAEMGLRKTHTDAKIEIESTDKLQSFYQETEQALAMLAKLIVDTGATVVFNFMTIDVRLMYMLAKKGVLTVKTTPESDIEKIALATGGKLVKNLNELTAKDLGAAGLVEVKKVAGGDFIFITDCDNPKAVTLFLRGGGAALLMELEGSMEDAIGVLRDVIEEPSVLPGGGATEMETAMRLRSFARSVRGREQLALFEYANALESLPKILAENGGFDPIDTVLALRVAHQKGKANHGVDLRTGKPEDMFELEVIEPLKVRRQAIISATETAIQILRIEDVVTLFAPKPHSGESEHEPTGTH